MAAMSYRGGENLVQAAIAIPPRPSELPGGPRQIETIDLWFNSPGWKNARGDGVMSSGVQEFSTDTLPERDRVSIWREEFARGVVKMDVRQLDEEAFRSESRIR